MEIDDKQVGILGLTIYDTETGRYGVVSCIKIIELADMPFLLPQIEYLKKGREAGLLKEHFINGRLKFVLRTPKHKNLRKETRKLLMMRKYKKIKDYMGEAFKMNMIMKLDDKECIERIKEQFREDMRE